MSVGFTPVNQVRLTNVAYVRLQKKGKRFEIACYRNKVLNWRNKIETDIEEVLQIDTVFTNVSKGLLASSKDLIEVFGTSDQKTVCEEILNKGELQVSEQERAALYESVYRDVASIVADKTVNSETNRPFTISMIQNAMKQIQYSVSVSKNSKSQALDVIRKLRDIMPIVRANMLLRVVCTAKDADAIRAELLPLGAVIVADNSVQSGEDHADPASSSRQCFLDLRIDPEAFRRVEEIVAEKTSGVGRVEVIQLRVANNYSATAAVSTNSSGVSHDKTNSVTVDNEDIQESTLLSSSNKAKTVPVSKSALQKEMKSRQRGNLIEQQILTSVDTAVSSALLEEFQHDNDSADESEEDIAIGMVRKGGKEKKKSKKDTKISGKFSNRTLSNIAEDLDDEDVSDDNEDDSNDVEHVHQLSTETQSVISSSSVIDSQSKVTPPQPNKKGKKSRRMEKEELREREKKVAALKERVVQQQQQQLQQQKNQHVFSSVEADASVDTSTVSSREDKSSIPSNVASGAISGTAQSCNTCGGAFRDAKDYRNHFRSEWHRYNLSRKLKGLPLVNSEEAFLALSLNELDL